MLKIISIIFLVLLVGLFPPAALAFISQDALPDDKIRYAIKRKLEEGILLISSIHPSTKAYFTVARSQRRFKEATALLNDKKDAKETLIELSSQTSDAVDEIKTIGSASRKSELISDLSESVLEYEKELNAIQSDLGVELLALDTSLEGFENPRTPRVVPSASTSSPAQPAPTTTTAPPPQIPSPSQPARIEPPPSTAETQSLRDRQDDIQKTLDDLKKIQEEIRKEQEKLREEAARRASEPVTEIPETGEVPPISEDIQNISGLDLLLEELYKVNINLFKDLIPE